MFNKKTITGILCFFIVIGAIVYFFPVLTKTGSRQKVVGYPKI